jgi:hypothetical protein
LAYSLAVFDDGSGPALYVGGDFVHAGGLLVNGIAKWKSGAWSALGIGLVGPYGGVGGPSAMAVFDEGAGPRLFVAGGFTSAGGVAAYGIAKWDGSSWSAVGSGTQSGAMALSAFDDGSGPALFAGGWMTLPGGSACLSKWDGSNWSLLAPPLDVNPIRALVPFDDGAGPTLFVSGVFTVSPAGDSYLTKWGNPSGCGAPGVSICEPGASGVSACPCGNPPAGSGLGCNNSSYTGGAALTATGIARLSYDTVVFTTSGEKPTATSVLLQGDNSSGAGAVFGQGVRCVSGSLKRMYVKAATIGSIQAPQTADLRVHMRSAALGDPIAPGTHRYYGVMYRDPIVLGGCPAASGFNITQQLDVSWSP